MDLSKIIIMVNIIYNSPCHQCQGLLVIKQVLETNLVVHDGLKALDTLQLNPIPLGVTKT
jgi:hypothetical protein